MCLPRCAPRGKRKDGAEGSDSVARSAVVPGRLPLGANGWLGSGRLAVVKTVEWAAFSDRAPVAAMTLVSGWRRGRCSFAEVPELAAIHVLLARRRDSDPKPTTLQRRPGGAMLRREGWHPRSNSAVALGEATGVRSRGAGFAGRGTYKSPRQLQYADEDRGPMIQAPCKNTKSLVLTASNTLRCPSPLWGLKLVARPVSAHSESRLPLRRGGPGICPVICGWLRQR